MASLRKQSSQRVELKGRLGFSGVLLNTKRICNSLRWTISISNSPVIPILPTSTVLTLTSFLVICKPVSISLPTGLTSEDFYKRPSPHIKRWFNNLDQEYYKCNPYHSNLVETIIRLCLHKHKQATQLLLYIWISKQMPNKFPFKSNLAVKDTKTD